MLLQSKVDGAIEGYRLMALPLADPGVTLVNTARAEVRFQNAEHAGLLAILRAC